MFESNRTDASRQGNRRECELFQPLIPSSTQRSQEIRCHRSRLPTSVTQATYPFYFRIRSRRQSFFEGSLLHRVYEYQTELASELEVFHHVGRCLATLADETRFLRANSAFRIPNSISEHQTKFKQDVRNNFASRNKRIRHARFWCAHSSVCVCVCVHWSSSEPLMTH